MNINKKVLIAGCFFALTPGLAFPDDNALIEETKRLTMSFDYCSGLQKVAEDIMELRQQDIPLEMSLSIATKNITNDPTIRYVTAIIHRAYKYPIYHENERELRSIGFSMEIFNWCIEGNLIETLQ